MTKDKGMPRPQQADISGRGTHDMTGFAGTAGAQMTAEQFRNEKLYETMMSLVKSLLSEGLISSEEYAEIDTKMVGKYRPVFGTLYSENLLTSRAL